MFKELKKEEALNTNGGNERSRNRDRIHSGSNNLEASNTLDVSFDAGFSAFSLLPTVVLTPDHLGSRITFGVGVGCVNFDFKPE